MRVYAQTPTGWVEIYIADPIPAPKSDIQTIIDDIAIIKTKLGIV